MTVKQSRSEIIDILYRRLEVVVAEFEFSPEDEQLVKIAMEQAFREGQLSKMFGDDYRIEA
jgi:hypothetical protein